MFETILVPLDGSEPARQVIPYVIEMARSFGSEVVLLGVCELDKIDDMQAYKRYLENEAERLRKQLKGTGGVRVVEVVGGAAEQILDCARKYSVNLIMLSSHGCSGIAPWALGSTAQRVLQKTAIPLMIIRARETLPKTGRARLFRRILAPLDGSERGEAVLPYVTELARKLKSELILMQVAEPGRYVHSIRGLEYVPFKDRDTDEMKARAQRYLDGVGSTVAGTGVAVRSEVRSGDCAREIIKFAGEMDCCLIAMASHGHSGVYAWVYGSVTCKVLEASKQPLLVVKPAQ
ncbi:MAG: universal stress protein [Chloroflexi bacterium]|nr:universal stress protein [Chloroflexota bacterium]